MKVIPYLHFNGQCEAAFNFYAKVLGGEITFMQRFADTPMADEMPPETRDQIIHAHLRIGEDELMASDASGNYYQQPQGLQISLQLSTVKEVERIFQALADGGTIIMPLEETFWSPRFGMLVDQYGTPWIINCEQPCGEEISP